MAQEWGWRVFKSSCWPSPSLSQDLLVHLFNWFLKLTLCPPQCPWTHQTGSPCPKPTCNIAALFLPIKKISSDVEAESFLLDFESMPAFQIDQVIPFFSENHTMIPFFIFFGWTKCIQSFLKVFMGLWSFLSKWSTSLLKCGTQVLLLMPLHWVNKKGLLCFEYYV